MGIENNNHDPVKVKAYFHADLAPEDTGSGESFWADPLPGHPATTDTHLAVRVDNLLIFAPFTYGDIVLVTPNDDQILQVVAILERSPHVTVGVGLVPLEDSTVDPVTQAAAGAFVGDLTATASHTGARTERLSSTSFLTQLPPTVTETELEGWVEGILAAAPTQLHTHELLIHTHELVTEVINTPTDPINVEWLDTSLQQADPTQIVDESVEPWDPAGSPEFAAAIRQARTDEHIPTWASDNDITTTASFLWTRDKRVRAAINNGNYWGVAVFAFRIWAPAGTVFPTLNRPLL